MKTLIELTKEINQIAGELATAESGLRQIESAGRDDSKTLDMYNRLRTKAELLKRRQGELEAQRPAAELESMKQEIDRLEKEEAATETEYKKVCEDTGALLAPLFDPVASSGVLSAALNNSLPVTRARIKVQVAQNVSTQARIKLIHFKEDHGMPI